MKFLKKLFKRNHKNGKWVWFTSKVKVIDNKKTVSVTYWKTDKPITRREKREIANIIKEGE